MYTPRDRPDPVCLTPKPRVFPKITNCQFTGKKTEKSSEWFFR